MILSGLYVPIPTLWSLHTKKERLQFVVCVTAAVISISAPLWGVCLMARSLVGEDPLSGEAMFKFGSIIFFALNFYLALFQGLDVCRHFKAWLEGLESYQNSYTTAENGETERLGRVMRIVTCVFMLVMMLIFIAIVVSAGDRLFDVMYFFKIEAKYDDTYFAFASFSIALVHYEFLRPCAALLLFLVISNLIAREVRRLNDDLLHEKLDKLQSSPQQLESYRLRHVSLCTLISDANRCLRHFLFAVYVFGTPFILLYMRGNLGTKAAGELKEMSDYWSVFDILQISVIIAVVTVVGAWISHLMHLPHEFLFKLNVQKMTGRASESVSMFLCRLQGQSLGFHVMHLFAVDTSTILMICGTFVTYAVVIIQFQPEVSGSCTATLDTSAVTWSSDASTLPAINISMA
ncbi:hypothetical protein V1264_016454 [Littorina saxatilis]|uniref:Gustatory receptor n=1 Tax=Littorina saxatilis TaxID=31220 RepID=A0AAN9GJ98_9CAEN